MLKKLWEKCDQWVVGAICFVLGFMARGLWNWLVQAYNWMIQLPVIGWLFK